MIFTELRFFAFFALVFGVYWALQSLPARKFWLLVTSFAFYAAWDWRFLGLIILSILVDYVVGLALERTEDSKQRRRWMLASLTANLGMLGLFKYFDFFVTSAANLLQWFGFDPHLPTLSLVLPVGISFFTFQTLSYSIDIYRRQLKATRNLLDLAVFVAFFPQLVAGPIVRAASFLPQLTVAQKFRDVAFKPYLALFLFGFIKKACIADNVAIAVDSYFGQASSYGSAAAWLAVALYAIQIYCDFSGYSDMAIATAGLLGFDLGENFHYPYLAVNLRDFWRRWHISLSTWLRDYLYISLGGNRRGPLRTYWNLIVTMALGGLWHGAAWRFLIWGLMHGFGLAIHRRFFEGSLASSIGTRREWITRGLSWGATLLWVCLAWIFFRAQDLSSAWTTVKATIGFSSPGTLQLDPSWWWLVAAFAAAHGTMSRFTLNRFEKLPALAFGIGWGFLFSLALLFVRTEAQPFIYFQF
jgi:alginate O-acetyltransferase complex protein AlgI